MATKKIIAKIPFTYMYPKPKEGGVEVKLLSDTVTTEADGGVNDGTFIVDWYLATDEGVTFKVVYDGTAYTATTYETEVGGGTQAVIGATWDGASFDFSVYPFFIVGNELITETAGEHTVELYATAYVAQITLTNDAESTEAATAWIQTIDEDGILSMPIDYADITAGESISVGVHYLDFPFYYVNGDGANFPANSIGYVGVDGGSGNINVECSEMTYDSGLLTLDEGATTASAEITITAA